MSTTFNTIVEEIQECSTEEKEELRSLLNRYLIEERRSEFLANHLDSLAERNSGTLTVYEKMDDLLADLENG